MIRFRRNTIDMMLDDFALVPLRAHRWDAGLDLRSPKTFIVPSKGNVTIDTGVHLQIPRGYVGMLKSKSGLNVKHNLTGEGVVDAGYSGSIVVKLYNHGEVPYRFEKGDKLIQIVLLPVWTPVVRIVGKFKETERSDKGFGSSGK